MPVEQAAAMVVAGRRGRPPAFRLEPGQRFGRLTVVEAARVQGRPAALCRCECGSEVTVRLSKLASGHTASCGCLRREQALANVALTAPWRASAENREHCAEMAKLPRTVTERKAEHLARLAADPNRRAKAAEHCRDMNAEMINGEPRAITDHDLCQVHRTASGVPLSFHDHKRTADCVPGVIISAGKPGRALRSPMAVMPDNIRRKVVAQRGRDWRARNEGFRRRCESCGRVFSHRAAWALAHPEPALECVDPASVGLIARQTKTGPVWGFSRRTRR